MGQAKKGQVDHLFREDDFPDESGVLLHLFDSLTRIDGVKP